MRFRIAGIDVHKKMLAVVVSDVEVDSEFQFERLWFGSNPEQLRSLVFIKIESGRGWSRTSSAPPASGCFVTSD